MKHLKTVVLDWSLGHIQQVEEHRSSWCSRRVGSRHSQLACCSTDSVEAHDASSLAVGPDKSRIATVGCSFAKVTIVDSLVFDSEELLCVLRPRCCPREEPAMLAGAVFRFATCGSRLQGSVVSGPATPAMHRR